ncbi:sterol desaturase/sphingolipid hydroxylase (fatty acid hydroxylase superfamily) [Pontibacter aydingkolensis]|uniref:Sterol desaturase family protein n=1 Tax=Pontibacter aydingkolensis TaxID=1911536 RepID=A0ABS7CT56_9BACT|nr:sterol desaturase family protein [Pontibacter aydingkolensis]MBW7467036.1 sterol desaturase family protein [Pontibacter aydingkolensis]
MKFLFAKFDKIGVPLLAGAAAALFILQAKYQLRKRVRPAAERYFENGSVALAALPTLRFALLPAMYAAAKWSNKNGVGLLQHPGIPKWLKYTAGFILLDYSNYLWHVLLHKWPLLWRFHNVHHIDMDLDLSTAWRFHIGENVASVPYRSLAVALSGVPAPLVVFYEIVFEGCTAFHHSNLKLPFWFERRLCNFIVTPRMHGIHHSIVARETNSNYSVVLSCWDRLHQTLRLNIPQQSITIGVPSYRSPADQSPKHLFLMPFEKPRPWQLPNGEVPAREELPGREHLLP